MTTHYIYVMGSESGSGKSTVCLGILALLLTAGYLPGELAYTKPITQCTDKQAVSLFCSQHNIPSQEAPPLIFSKGYSKNFIDGKTPSSAELLANVRNSILNLGQDKKVVIIDALGGPSSGSVIGVSNVDVALSLPCKVLFVGKPGIGAALDDTVLCVNFMQHKGLTDIAVIYNKIPLLAFDDIRKYLSLRMPALLPGITLLGFIVLIPNLGACLNNNSSKEIAQWFGAYLNPQGWIGLT
ncbi:MAG: AAA family ATPase [Methylococcales bacterium]|nr:AAA family ATPase [Methylococcales bacterium]